MVLGHHPTGARRCGSPHPRGDGPPARRYPSTGLGSPHPRGDGPSSVRVTPAFTWFSPPAWGWSLNVRYGTWTDYVLPTRVGMVPSHTFERPVAACSPHPRGDGPIIQILDRGRDLFSPPAWGWSRLTPDPMDRDEILRAQRMVARRWRDAPRWRALARVALRREWEYQRHANRRARAGRDWLPDWAGDDDPAPTRRELDAEWRALFLSMTSHRRKDRKMPSRLDTTEPTVDPGEKPGPEQNPGEERPDIPEKTGFPEAIETNSKPGKTQNQKSKNEPVRCTPTMGPAPGR